jgi:hypothetical protein
MKYNREKKEKKRASIKRLKGKTLECSEFLGDGS